ncbi:MAG: acetyltransferase [Myxococcales bacterium]|nr:acetyltransferase [Myxococcales bacterium]
MSDLVIRHCGRADLRELEWSRQIRADRRLIETVFQATHERGIAMLVARIERTLVGQIWIDFDRKPDIALLWALRVRPGWRGHGIGSQLIIAGEREARRKGACATELAVEPHNQRARALYRRLGYRTVGYEIATQALSGAPLGFELELMRRWVARR